MAAILENQYGGHPMVWSQGTPSEIDGNDPYSYKNWFFCLTDKYEHVLNDLNNCKNNIKNSLKI